MADSRHARMTDALKRCMRYMGLQCGAAPNAFNVVLLAADFEAIESDQTVSEAGFTFLDTHYIQGMPPGDRAENWMKQAKSVHYLVTEDGHGRPIFHGTNEHARGDPYGFTLSTTRTMTTLELREELQTLFHRPFGANGRIKDKRPSLRRFVVIAHAMESELKYFEQLGLLPTQHPQTIDFIDTQDIEQAMRRHAPAKASQARQLGKILKDTLGVQPEGLHNAGWDAHYTMHALLALLVKCANEKTISKADQEWATVGDGGPGVIPLRGDKSWNDVLYMP